MTSLLQDLEAMLTYQKEGWPTTTIQGNKSYHEKRMERHDEIVKNIYNWFDRDRYTLVQVAEGNIYARSTVYKILEELVDKGKLGKVKIGVYRYFKT